MINYSSQRILLEAIRALKARQQQGGQAAGAGRIAQRPAQPTVVSWPGSERQTLPNYPPPQQPAGGGEVYGQNVPMRQPMTQPPEQFDSAFGADQRNFAPQTQAQPRQGKTLLQRGGGLLAELLRGVALGKGGYQKYQMMKQTEDIRKQQARDEMNRWIQQLGMQEGKERRMFDYKEAMEKPKKANIKDTILEDVAAGRPLTPGKQKVWDELMTSSSQVETLVKLLGNQIPGSASEQSRSIPFTTEELTSIEAQLIKDGFKGVALQKEIDRIKAQGKPINPQ